jgi:hypothetical protein
MTTPLGEAQVPIRATLDKLDGDLAAARGKVEGAIGGIGKKLQTIGKVAVAGAAAGIAAIGLGIGAVASQAIPAASNLNEALNATNVVFGDAAGKVQEFGKIAADVAGMSAAEFNQMAAQTGAMLQNYGFEAGEAAQASIDLGTRAADMASIFNTDVSEAMTAINAALRGEADPIERYGVSMNAAAVEAQALAMGFEKVGGSFSTAAMTQARLALLMEQTDKIAGDFVNTSGDLANATRVNEARWENFMAQVGTVGLPIMTTVQRVLLDVGEKVFPIVAGALERIQPVVEGVANAVGAFVGALLDGQEPIGAAKQLIEEVGAALGLSKDDAGELATKFGDVVAAVQDFVAKVQETLEPITTWIGENVKLTDVLIALGAAILSVVVPAVLSAVAAAAPVVLLFAGITLAVALLRKAWEENFLGIQEKVAEVWSIIKPVFDAVASAISSELPGALETLRALWVDTVWPAIQKAVEIVWPILMTIFTWYVDWYSENIPKAIEVLRSFWVETAWPAIQRAVEIVWPIIQAIFTALVDFVAGTLIPTVQSLYQKWTQEIWPTIQTVTENVWTVLEEIFTEIGRWINDNIVPWVEYLNEVWTETVWPAIQEALENAWEVIEPIWKSFKEWLGETLPPIIEGLQTLFEGVMSGISEAVSPVKKLWDDFISAVKGFWNWISSKVFSFKISIPDLPEWALPGSPLPIHTAWRNFADDMDHTVIRPRIDLDRLPVAAVSVPETAGPAGQTTQNYYNVTAQYAYQDERSLTDDLRLLEMMTP